jgi:spore germination cell wall hydrolase CwlJ-like protein
MDFSSEIAVRTIWMEARGDGEAAMRAVAHVLVNRLKTRRWGSTLAQVCLAPLQFSSWNTSDPNRRAMAALDDDDSLLNEIRIYLADALSGEPDPTNGSTHYYATTIAAPNWIQGAKLQAQIGRQLFYSGVA